MEQSKVSDNKLLLDFKQGDIRAFNSLFARYFTSIYKYALRYQKDSLCAEELAMDVMLRFWKQREQIPESLNIRAYLFTSIHRALIDKWRKKENIMVSILDEQLDFLADSSTIADHLIQQQEINQHYHSAILKLQPKEKEAFLLSREEDLSYLEIAEQMNISVNTVKSHLKNSLRIMRLHFYDLVKIIPFLFIFLK